ncbi:MAG TPA: hypothetical protein VFK30_14290, partial [Anaerolineae bacterium]|nr:hypothetical protein [Anaerolineae bacterium]
LAPVHMSSMVKINGIGRMTVGEMREAVKNGARFVVFEYVLSFIVISRRRVSLTYFVRPGESMFAKSLGYNLITLLMGWWSFPFGPGLTIGAIRDNLRGGTDVSVKVIDQILAAADKSINPKNRQT